MTHTNQQFPVEMCSRKWPEDQKPIWPGLVVWTWVHIDKHMSVFPSIEPPKDYNAPMVCLGPDYDGSLVFMVIKGPDMGCTMFSRENVGTPCTIH
jgi:hypothetical protein